MYRLSFLRAWDYEIVGNILLARDARILPEGLQVLQDVFDQSCESSEIPKSSADAAALATILMRRLQYGRRDRAVLRMIAANLLSENL